MTKKQYKKLMKRLDEIERLLLAIQPYQSYPWRPDTIPAPWVSPTITWGNGTGAPLPDRGRIQSLT